MSEYKFEIYFHTDEHIKIRINLNVLLPFFKDLMYKKEIDDFYFDTHWAHGGHINYICKISGAEERINKIYESLSFLVANISIEMNEKYIYNDNTLNDLALMENYKGDYLPVYDHKAVKLLKYKGDNIQTENENIHKLYHEYFYKFRPYLEELLKKNLDSRDDEKLVNNLKFILEFANNVLDNDAIHSLFLSFSSHYYSFASHSHANLAKGYISNFEKIYINNKDFLNSLVEETLNNRKSSKLRNLIYEFSQKIRVEYNKVPMETRKEKTRDTIDFIKSSYSEKNIFHKKWIEQPNIEEILLGETYNINRFLVNYIYLLYPILYISPSEKHLYGYILSKTLSTYLNKNDTIEDKKRWKRYSITDSEREKYII